MAKSPADPGCRGFLQVVMDRTLADQASSGDLPLRQLESKAEAQDFLDLSHGHCSSLALDLSRKVYRRNSLPRCHVQRHFALWKTSQLHRDHHSRNHEKLITIIPESKAVKK